MNRSIEDQAMPLIIVRTSVVLPDIKVVNRRTEKKLTHIIERFRICVRNAVVPPSRRPLNKRHMQSVVVRVRKRRVLAVIGVSGVRTASIVVAGSNAHRHILVDQSNQVQSSDMLVANADRVTDAELF